MPIIVVGVWRASKAESTSADVSLMHHTIHKPGPDRCKQFRRQTDECQIQIRRIAFARAATRHLTSTSPSPSPSPSTFLTFTTTLTLPTTNDITINPCLYAPIVHEIKHGETYETPLHFVCIDLGCFRHRRINHNRHRKRHLLV